MVFCSRTILQKFCICYMINITAYSLLSTLCITVKIEIRSFSENFLLFFFFFLNLKIQFLPLLFLKCHCVKIVRIWIYSGPYFPAFGLNTERYSFQMGESTDQNTDQKRTIGILAFYYMKQWLR